MATVISMLGIARIVIAEIEGQPGSTVAPSVLFGYQVPPDASGFRAPPSAKPYEIVSRFWFLGFEIIRGRVNFTQIVVPWWFLFCCTGAFPGLLLMGIVKSCWCVADDFRMDAAKSAVTTCAQRLIAVRNVGRRLRPGWTARTCFSACEVLATTEFSP
jgi:hypothetical protein